MGFAHGGVGYANPCPPSRWTGSAMRDEGYWIIKGAGQEGHNYLIDVRHLACHWQLFALRDLFWLIWQLPGFAIRLRNEELAHTISRCSARHSKRLCPFHIQFIESTGSTPGTGLKMASSFFQASISTREASIPALKAFSLGARNINTSLGSTVSSTSSAHPTSYICP